VTGKRPPEQRWRDHQRDQYDSFRKSRERNDLTDRGLAILGRSGRVKRLELWEFTSSLGESAPDWLDFIHDCKAVGERFGLAATTVVHSCLIAGYRPGYDGLGIGLPAVEVVVVTRVSSESPFFRNLYAHASDLHLAVETRDGRFLPSRRGFVMRGDGAVTETIPWGPLAQLTADRLPPRARAFKMRVEFPPGIPHEVVAECARAAAQAGDELARRLGYPVPQRLRQRGVARRD